METAILDQLPGLLDALGYGEMPMGIFYTDQQPEQGISPKAMPGMLPTREKEAKGEIDWQAVFGDFSCAIGNIWRARKKHAPAFFDAERFGCPGGAFYLGFLGPQTETITYYVSTGVTGRLPGEHYFESPQACSSFFETIDPLPAPARFCVVKPLDLFQADEEPDLVAFFCRSEVLCGLHQLATYVTNDIEAVLSPFGAGCSNLITWPYRYLAEDQLKAVLGGWDPSARKYFKTDELSFTVPWQMFTMMLQRWRESFLTTKTWSTVKKKVEHSARAWGE